MSAVTEYFFTPVYYPRTTWTVVHWWEARRPVYNMAVGAAGVLSLFALKVSASLPPHPVHGEIPWQAVLAYALLANLAYTIGPVVDLAITRRWGHEYAPVGPALFRYGFVFSVGLTLLPIALAVLSWIGRVLEVLL